MIKDLKVDGINFRSLLGLEPLLIGYIHNEADSLDLCISGARQIIGKKVLWNCCFDINNSLIFFIKKNLFGTICWVWENMLAIENGLSVKKKHTAIPLWCGRPNEINENECDVYDFECKYI